MRCFLDSKYLTKDYTALFPDRWKVSCDISQDTELYHAQGALSLIRILK